tara:strand:- start:247 stop:1038 length:792 start_codon:yes stop_codon:yes gene_type:complete
MFKIFKTFLIVISLVILKINNVYAVNAAADVYKITMKKIEFCTGSTGVDVCTNSVTVADTELEIDIASVSAGATAASYGNPALLPLGETYTHVRVTIDRKITARNKTAVDTGTSDSTDDCNTTATTEARYNNGESARKYIFKPVAEEGGTRAEERFYLYNGTYFLCVTATCGNLIANQKVTYGQGTGSSKYQTQHAEGSTSDDHVLVYELTSPYTVSLMPPVLDISFGTSTALAVTEFQYSPPYNTKWCLINVNEPVVNVTIK